MRAAVRVCSLLFPQSDDYLTLKSRVLEYAAGGGAPEGIATIDIAIETLKVAEYLTPLLKVNEVERIYIHRVAFT